MNHKRILNKAYKRLLEIYGGERVTPDIGILNRFYKEKMMLNECELYTRCLGLLGEIRKAADDRGEHIFVRGTTGSSFVAYLLGATDTNPLPRHVYCPD